MKKFLVALCLTVLSASVIFTSVVLISAAAYEVQEEVASPFNILPDKPKEK